jgi:hypothetical protein
MSEYQVIAVYAAFAFAIFGLAVIWHRHGANLRKRFHLLNYRSKNDDNSKPANHPI